MKHFSLLFIALAGLVMACCTKIEKVDLEEQASDCLWFCKSRREVLSIDKKTFCLYSRECELDGRGEGRTVRTPFIR
jgi:hypothetical protein